jgi:transcriptional regulator with XRE-family HTH domain
MSMTHRPNDALRYQRRMRGWSLQRVADGIATLCIERTGKRPGVNADMVGEWERGVKRPSPFYQEMLCLLYGCTADKLLFDVPAVPEVLAGENDMKRRELLRLLSAGGSALVLSFAVDWERIEGAVARPSLLDSAVVEDLATINGRFWSLYLGASAKSAILEGVTGQLKTLVQFLQEPHTEQVHRRLCALVGDLAQLAGEIHFDRHEPDLAASCYVFAAEASREARVYDLWSCALTRHAFLPLYDKQYTEALPLLKEASQLAARGDSQLPTRYWAAAVEAEAQSGSGRLVDCQRALEIAQGVTAITTAGPAWTRFDASRLPALRGACYVRLAQPNLAVPSLHEALKQFEKPGRKRGMVLLDLAQAAVQGQDIDQACAYLDQVVDIVELGASGFLKKGVAAVRGQLQPFASTALVRAFDQRLRALA